MRYTMVKSDIWVDDDCKKLTPKERYLYLYMITSPLLNQSGYYRLPIPYAAFDTGLDADEIESVIKKDTKHWKYDETSMQILLPTYLKYNKIAGENSVKGMVAQIEPLKKCPLHIDFIYSVNRYIGAEAVGYFSKEVLVYVREACNQRLEKNPHDVEAFCVKDIVAPYI